MKYTANRTHGVGQVTDIDEKHVTIYFEDTDTEKRCLVKFTTLYDTEEEAERSLIDDEMKEDTSRYVHHVDQAWEDAQERSKMNQRPSSMR